VRPALLWRLPHARTIWYNHAIRHTLHEPRHPIAHGDRIGVPADGVGHGHAFCKRPRRGRYRYRIHHPANCRVACKRSPDAEQHASGEQHARAHRYICADGHAAYTRANLLIHNCPHAHQREHVAYHHCVAYRRIPACQHPDVGRAGRHGFPLPLACRRRRNGDGGAHGHAATGPDVDPGRAPDRRADR